METERLMRQEIERLEGLLDAGIKQALKDLADENEAEAEEGQGMLTEEAVEFASRLEALRITLPSRQHARLKSPAILASKARLRARKVARLTARLVDEGRNNVDRPRDLAWNRKAIPEVDERVARGEIGMFTVPSYSYKYLAEGHRW